MDYPRHTYVAAEGNPVVDLVAIVDAYLAASAQSGEVMQALLMQVPQQPELKNAMATVIANIGDIVSIIQQYQAQGRLQRTNPFTLLSALLGPLMTNMMLRRGMPALPVPDINPQAHVAAFLHGQALRDC